MRKTGKFSEFRGKIVKRQVVSFRSTGDLGRPWDDQVSSHVIPFIRTLHISCASHAPAALSMSLAAALCQRRVRLDGLAARLGLHERSQPRRIRGLRAHLGGHLRHKPLAALRAARKTGRAM